MPSKNPIFISYAPEDLAAAQQVAAALQDSGIEARVTDTKSGDLKNEIESSALFLALISQNAESHEIGSFRNEWEIAANYMDTLPRGVPFLLPIIIDDTEEYGMTTPEAFGGVHWIRQPDGETSADLIQEVARLLTIPRGPVYFPPIPPGLSRPPFSLKKKSKIKNKLPEKKRTPRWVLPMIGGVAAVIMGALGFIMFSTPTYENLAPTAPEQNPELIDEPTVVEAPVGPEPPPPEPEPEPVSDDVIWAEYESARLTHNYQAAADRLNDWISRQAQADPQLLLTLAWVKFARDLDPEAYLARVTQISSADSTTTETWLPPIAYGLNRDFANQRRAIRAGAGAIAVQFEADTSKAEVALTESYMDQGNWALARHYGNQTRRVLQEPLNAATVGPVISGQFEAFLGMTQRSPEVIGMLDRLLANHEAGREVTKLLLIRALIDQGNHDRALELIGQALRQPSLLDPAIVLFLPPYDQLHSHSAFRATIEPHADGAKIEAAMAWVAERLSGSPARTTVY